MTDYLREQRITQNLARLVEQRQSQLQAPEAPEDAPPRPMHEIQADYRRQDREREQRGEATSVRPSSYPNTPSEKDAADFNRLIAQAEQRDPTLKPPAPDFRGTLSLAEAAEHCGCSEHLLAYLCHAKNRAPHRVIGDQLRFHKRELNKMMRLDHNWRRL